jgi:type IV pilus assembly protein PilA
MKIFCSKCGQARELEDSAAGAIVTCGSCGNRFSVGGQVASSSSNSTTTVVVVVVGALVAVPVVVAIIGMLAAIAIPNFIRYQARSKQAECRTNLKALGQLARADFEAHHRYTPALAELGFSPERGNRYAYFAGPGTRQSRSQAQLEGAPTDTQIGVDSFKFPNLANLTEHDLPATLAGSVALGVSGTCPDCALVAACVGNIDNDATLDVWSVSTADRRGPGGQTIPAGVPFNDLDDINQ